LYDNCVPGPRTSLLKIGLLAIVPSLIPIISLP
jgi:hypothetical protein